MGSWLDESHSLHLNPDPFYHSLYHLHSLSKFVYTPPPFEIFVWFKTSKLKRKSHTYLPLSFLKLPFFFNVIVRPKHDG